MFFHLVSFFLHPNICGVFPNFTEINKIVHNAKHEFKFTFFIFYLKYFLFVTKSFKAHFWGWKAKDSTRYLFECIDKIRKYMNIDSAAFSVYFCVLKLVTQTNFRFLCPKMAHRLLPSLPRIKVPIGHIPQRLKMVGFENPQARLEILRMMVNRIFREERCEFKYNRAEECRPYIDRVEHKCCFLNNFYVSDFWKKKFQYLFIP